MLDTVTVTVTKINGESFGIGLQDYYGGSRVRVLVPGGAGASVRFNSSLVSPVRLATCSILRVHVLVPGGAGASVRFNSVSPVRLATCSILHIEG